MTVRETEYVPAVVGVPEMAPPVTVNPGGNPVAVQVYGVVPPVAESGALYPTPTVPAVSDAVVMRSGEVATLVPSVILSNPMPFVVPPKFTDLAVPLNVTPIFCQQLKGWFDPLQNKPVATREICARILPLPPGASKTKTVPVLFPEAK